MHDVLRKFINEITTGIIADDEFVHIEKGFFPKLMKRRQFLLHEGAVCKYMAFVVKGALRQYSIDERGNEHIVHFGIEGCWITDRESLLMLRPSKYNIDALEDCELLLTTKEQLSLITDLSLQFLKMSHILDSQHSISFQNRIQASLSYTAEEKVMDLMIRYPSFFNRFPQSMLASYLGLSPETFSRIRKKLLTKQYAF
ncbi:Crp/Fnr family transcriptional regulator [Chitinophagaceae bacterium 26-R-25]|nr:Crp/Fnr family transcriptional regulator [Chitinophagaceae bacterium 26-R-25]